MWLSTDARPLADWDDTVLTHMGRAEATVPGRVVLTGTQGRFPGATRTFPTWSTRGGAEHPLADGGRTGGGDDDDGGPAPVLVTRACTEICVARTTTWARLVPVHHPDPDLALSAALGHSRRTTFVAIPAGVAWGGTPLAKSDEGPPSGPARALLHYAARAGLALDTRLRVVQVSGRARLGLTTADPPDEEILAKFGSHAEFDRQRDCFTT